MKASVDGDLLCLRGVFEWELNGRGREYDNENSVHGVTEMDTLNFDKFI
jgi:hypothetical protein